MRKKLIQFAGLFCFTGLFAATPTVKSIADYQVIPLPNEISVQKKQPFVLDKHTIIVYTAGNVKLKKNAEFLAQYLKDITGCTYKTSSKSTGKKLIILSSGLKNDNPDAYRIVVKTNQIVITGATENGTFYGIQTLRKSIPVAKTEKVEFPTVIVNDAPCFAYRGMMLDVSRHFFTVDEVKTYIDMLALHNINNFHWHLTDDQGWRVEIKKYPGLTEIGSKRTETVIGHNTGKYDGIPYKGFYTQDQCREIIAYAADRCINIIPEIDMPGHMLGALAAYPELGCTGGPYQVWRQWGVSEDVLCAGNDKTLKFIEDVLSELVEIFPSKYIHIGGDECPKSSWVKCPKCQARIKSLGLVADGKHSAEERLQSYFIGYAEKVLNSKGRRIIGWDEILEGGIAPNATVMSWRGMEGGIEAAKQKHDVIMTPNSHVYFDHYQTSDIESEPMAIGGYTPVKRVYGWEPMPSALNDEDKKHIIGAQANLWTEYVPTFKQAEYMVLPRMAALCEVQWTKPELKNYDDFLKRLPRLIDFYNVYGYNYAKHLFDITADFTSNAKEGSIDVSMSTLDNAPIRYTLDGTTPTENSSVYSGLLKIKENTNLKAIIFRNQQTSRMLSDNIKFSKSTTRPITAIQPLSGGYQYKGVSTLVDGLKGRSNYKTGRWIGFYKSDLNVVIDLEKNTTIQEAAISTCVEKGDWIFDARSFTVEVSNDGVNFSQVAAESYPAMQQQDANGVFNHNLTFSPVQARYVKVIVTSERSIPEWHGGKGNAGYLFVDEININ
jgi:hexosaminidase